MSFTQLDPPLPLTVLGKGDGFAIAVIDYGQEHNLIWVTAISETGEIWCAPNPKVRMQGNWTMGRQRRGDVGKGDCLQDGEAAVDATDPQAWRERARREGLLKTA